MAGKKKSAKYQVPSKKLIEKIIRVDHAGEYGAKRIYQGQMAVLGKTPRLKKLLQDMMDHELEHLEYFESAIPKRRVRPTALLPLWHIGGFAMGAVTALMGEKAAMACTVAVEEVIEKHYQQQLQALGEAEPALRAAIAKFMADEVHHRDIGLHHGAEDAPAYRALYAVISGITKTAIRLSERV
jgi:ubiquinone biosynthesis monooxygenase Coq7